MENAALGRHFFTFLVAKCERRLSLLINFKHSAVSWFQILAYLCSLEK